jgi:hypothetical protein
MPGAFFGLPDRESRVLKSQDGNLKSLHGMRPVPYRKKVRQDVELDAPLVRLLLSEQEFGAIEAENRRPAAPLDLRSSMWAGIEEGETRNAF